MPGIAVPTLHSLNRMRENQSWQAIVGIGILLAVFWYGLRPNRKAEPAPVPAAHSKMERPEAVKQLVAQASVGMPSPRLREVASSVTGWLKQDSAPAFVESDDVKTPAIAAGMAALDRKDFKEAKASFLSVLNTDPNDLKALRGLDAAFRGYASADDSDAPGDAQALRENLARNFETEATSALRDGNLQTALESAQTVISLSPEGGSSHQAAQQLIQEALAAKTRSDFQASRY